MSSYFSGFLKNCTTIASRFLQFTKKVLAVFQAFFRIHLVLNFLQDLKYNIDSYKHAYLQIISHDI